MNQHTRERLTNDFDPDRVIWDYFPHTDSIGFDPRYPRYVVREILHNDICGNNFVTFEAAKSLESIMDRELERFANFAHPQGIRLPKYHYITQRIASPNAIRGYQSFMYATRLEGIMLNAEDPEHTPYLLPVSHAVVEYLDDTRPGQLFWNEGAHPFQYTLGRPYGTRQSLHVYAHDIGPTVNYRPPGELVADKFETFEDNVAFLYDWVCNLAHSPYVDQARAVLQRVSILALQASIDLSRHPLRHAIEQTSELNGLKDYWKRFAYE